jgi:hypothetical protein
MTQPNNLATILQRINLTPETISCIIEYVGFTFKYSNYMFTLIIEMFFGMYSYNSNTRKSTLDEKINHPRIIKVTNVLTAIIGTYKTDLVKMLLTILHFQRYPRKGFIQLDTIMYKSPYFSDNISSNFADCPAKLMDYDDLYFDLDFETIALQPDYFKLVSKFIKNMIRLRYILRIVIEDKKLFTNLMFLDFWNDSEFMGRFENIVTESMWFPSVDTTKLDHVIDSRPENPDLKLYGPEDQYEIVDWDRSNGDYEYDRKSLYTTPEYIHLIRETGCIMSCDWYTDVVTQLNDINTRLYIECAISSLD